MDFIPKVDHNDVKRIVDRDFLPEQHDEIIRLLGTYGSKSWQQAPDRVRIAILKLSAGNLEAVQKHLEAAKSDFRDVVAPAEYPGMCKIGLLAACKLPPDPRKKLREDDWAQYEQWLRAEQSPRR